MEMVAGEEGLGPRASVSNVVNKDSSSRSAGGRGRWVLRRTVVQVAVLVGALTLLSPATGLQALKPEGRMAFLSRTIIQSFIHRLNRKHHDAGENHPPNLCHKTDGVCRSRGAFQTRSTTRSASATPMQGHSSLACGGMCAPNDSQAVSSQEGGEAPPATIPRRSESDPALHMRLRRGDADSLVAPRTQSPPMRRADGEDAACDAALPDMADITWEEDGEGMDPLEMLQSNATLESTNRTPLRKLRKRSQSSPAMGSMSTLGGYCRAKRDPELRDARARNTIQNLDYVANNRGYRTIGAIMEAIDMFAGWKTPALSGTTLVTRKKAKMERWTDKYEHRNLTLTEGNPEATLLTTWEEEESSSSSSSDVEIDHTLDVKRTLLNVGLFLSTVAGWRGIWEMQEASFTWYQSLGIGAALYLSRFKMDEFLGTQRVHEEEWYELFSQMPAFTYSPEVMSEYFKIYFSTSLVFISSLFIWRGIWAAMDDSKVTWYTNLAIATVSYVILSYVQLNLEKKRLADRVRDGDDGRSPSLYTDSPLMRRELFDPQEFEGDESTTDETSEDERRERRV